jgi:hypothetical protein
MILCTGSAIVMVRPAESVMVKGYVVSSAITGRDAIAMHKMAAKQLHLDLDGIELSLYSITGRPFAYKYFHFRITR